MELDLLNLLKSCKIFSSLDEKILIKLLNKFKKISINKNKILYKQGDLSNNIFLLASGKIAIYLTTGKKETLLINEVLPGTLMGELSALSHEPRAATAKAVKKSILFQLASEEFVNLCKEFNSVSLEVINTTLSKSRSIIKQVTDKGGLRKHIAIIPANKEIELNVLYEEISKYIKNYADIVLLSDSEEIKNKKTSLSELQDYINKLDKENKTIICLIASHDSTLANIYFGFERVDMIYVVAMGNSRPMISREAHAVIDNNKYKIKPELILLHQNKQGFPTHTSKWLQLVSFNLHHHIRINEVSDWQRLLRFITGNAVGIVLGGGGLRCWAQLGALRALKKLNIPIDAIGGTSAGAIVAGYYAMNQSIDGLSDLRELSEITRRAVSLKNLTWPAASLFNGKDYTLKLQEMFNKVRIENLWIPCFCVSTNLANNKQIISRKGYLWRIIRSSTAVPLVFPPVVTKGKLYLDGGLLNNLPVDIMKKIISNKGKIIAIELTHSDEDSKHYNFPPILPFWQTMLAKFGLAYKDYKLPHPIDTFLKSLLAGASAKQRENSMLADILITPDLSKFHLLNISKSDEAKLIKIGYEATIEKIKR